MKQCATASFVIMATPTASLATCPAAHTRPAPFTSPHFRMALLSHQPADQPGMPDPVSGERAV